jgi:hypothetical protein
MKSDSQKIAKAAKLGAFNLSELCALLFKNHAIVEAFGSELRHRPKGVLTVLGKWSEWKMSGKCGAGLGGKWIELPESYVNHPHR